MDETKYEYGATSLTSFVCSSDKQKGRSEIMEQEIGAIRFHTEQKIPSSESLSLKTIDAFMCSI
jgi:hypothetical protein